MCSHGWRCCRQLRRAWIRLGLIWLVFENVGGEVCCGMGCRCLSRVFQRWFGFLLCGELLAAILHPWLFPSG